MRDPATNDDVPTPARPHADIRTVATEVLRRVEEWRHAPGWRDDEPNRRRYQATAAAITAMHALPATADTATLGATLRPILDAWHPPRLGPEQAIHAVVDRLRVAIDGNPHDRRRPPRNGTD